MRAKSKGSGSLCDPLPTCTRSMTSLLTPPPRCCPYCVAPPLPVCECRQSAGVQGSSAGTSRAAGGLHARQTSASARVNRRRTHLCARHARSNLRRQAEVRRKRRDGPRQPLLHILSKSWRRRRQAGWLPMTKGVEAAGAEQERQHATASSPAAPMRCATKQASAGGWAHSPAAAGARRTTRCARPARWCACSWCRAPARVSSP